MKLFLPVRRATLLIPSGPEGDQDRKHLFILLTDPHDDGTGCKRVLLVSTSTVKPNAHHDPACLLYEGDHPFIKRKSYIVYQRARIEQADKITRGLKNGVFIQQEVMDSAIFARVCKGLEESMRTAPDILAFYRQATSRP